jgi:hypothetical protein
MRYVLVAIWVLSFTSALRAQTQVDAPNDVTVPRSTPSAPDSRRPCAVPFTYIFSDSVGNVHKGLSSKDAKWFAEKVSKKYPEVCYVQPEQWANLARPTYAFFVNEQIEHGVTYETATKTSTQDVPLSGTVKDEDGETVGRIEGTTTQTTTTRTTTPREITKRVDGLRLEAMQSDGSWKVFHVFPFKIRGKQEFWGLPVSQQRNLLEDAAKWIHEGGLTDSRQTVLQ